VHPGRTGRPGCAHLRGVGRCRIGSPFDLIQADEGRRNTVVKGCYCPWIGRKAQDSVMTRQTPQQLLLFIHTQLNSSRPRSILRPPYGACPMRAFII
jgi:hypothetical protein